MSKRIKVSQVESVTGVFSTRFPPLLGTSVPKLNGSSTIMTCPRLSFSLYRSHADGCQQNDVVPRKAAHTTKHSNETESIHEPPQHY